MEADKRRAELAELQRRIDASTDPAEREQLRDEYLSIATPHAIARSLGEPGE